MLYNEIHRLRKEGFSKSKIASKLQVSRNLVIDYAKMSPEEFLLFSLSLQNRSKKLDAYQKQILAWLKEHPDFSGAQIYDRLIEKEKMDPAFVTEGTVRNYLRELREVYHLPKKMEERKFSAVPELPMGQQIQVDFGQTNQETTSGAYRRLYFIAFILAHSRYKYVEWLDRPFTTADLIRTHENAFRYFGGIPIEMVYDQDRLLTVSENAGDLILTADFTRYQQARDFKIYLCRAADPQSKGKIEQVVKYVKNNFAKHRIFDNLDDWQEDSMRWLTRTGNYKMHHNTKKRPFEVHALEKQQLRNVSGTYLVEGNFASSIPKLIQKDNVIRHGGNRYSVPLGTYRKGAPNHAYVSEENGYLLIRLQENGHPIARHPLSTEKGKLISDPVHRERDLTKRNQMIRQVLESFGESPDAAWLIEILTAQYPRHVMDQLRIVQATILAYPNQATEALRTMKRLGMKSAHEFRDIATSLEVRSHKELPKEGVMNAKYEQYTAPERKEDIYRTILEGSGR